MIKSKWNDNGIFHVQVDGVWISSSVKGHLRQAELQSLEISRYALRFAERNPDTPVTTEIDLSGITAIDESGWKILTLWLKHLQHQGLNPVIVSHVSESTNVTVPTASG